MTREEAKEILTHNWTRVDNPNYSESELDEAFFMAIEALSERNIAMDIATILENEQDMRVILQNDAVNEDTQTERRVDHDRDWIIGCIKHDGFIKTDRFDKANQIILDALQFAEHFDLLKEHESLQEVVHCKDCRHADECHKSVQYTRNEPNTVTIGYTKIDFCSHGERREP